MLKTQEYTKLRREHDRQFNESTIKEIYLRDAIAEYSKRLSKYCKLKINMLLFLV